MARPGRGHGPAVVVFDEREGGPRARRHGEAGEEGERRGDVGNLHGRILAGAQRIGVGVWKIEVGLGIGVGLWKIGVSEGTGVGD